MSRMDRRSAVSIPVSAADERLHASPVAGWPVFAWVSSSVTVTASASSHTVGAWTELVASTSEQVDWLVVSIASVSASGTDTAALLDLGTGAASSETVIASSIPAGGASGTSAGSRQNQVHVVPVNVPAGSRIAARLQALISADTANVVVAGYRSTSARYRSPSSVVTLGANTASSRGTNMPTSDTYVEITSATTVPLQALVLCPVLAGGTAIATEASVYTVAVGGAGSESAIGSSTIGTNAAETIGRQDYDLFGIIPVAIPTGSRIACKQSVGRNYRDVIILGVPVS